jgi:putative peptidoglycan lipid II flippase
MVPIAVLGALLRMPVVEILFGSGQIAPDDLQLIALTLTAFLIGLTAHAMIAVLARAFYARQDTATPVAAAVGAVAINCTLAVVLVGPLGLPGIALAIAIAAWVEAGVLLAILYRRLPHFELRGLARVGVESIAGSVVAGGAAYLVIGLIGNAIGADPGRLLLAVQVIVVSVVFAAVYARLSDALRIPELPSIVGVMVDVLRRPRPS